MTLQTAHYRQPQAQFVRFKAYGNERVALAGFLGGVTLALGASTTSEARPIGAAYEASTHSRALVCARQEDFSPANALWTIKQSAGLTWAQLALLLDVSRTTIHDWTCGTKLRPGSQAKLASLLDRVRSMADLPKFKVRNALLGPTCLAAAASQKGAIVVSDNTPPRHRLLLEDATEILG